MQELDDFLWFIFERLSDHRVEFYKKMKYGFCFYYINLNLKYSDSSSKIRDSKTLNIVVDCRNNCIEVGQWEHFIVFENQELTKKWAALLEEVYSKSLSENLKIRVQQFFDNVDPSDKDFGRSWKIKDWFND